MAQADPPGKVLEPTSVNELAKAFEESTSHACLCVLFHASFSPGAVTADGLRRLAGQQQKALFAVVDLENDEQEDLALDMEVGAVLPVARVYAKGASLSRPPAASFEGAQFTEKQLEDKVRLQIVQALEQPGGDVHDVVRKAYASTVAGGASILPFDVGDPHKRRELLGYKEEDVTESSDLGLGCGNPLIAAKLRPGEVAVDLGSGAGMDCFIAGRQVGPQGHVIGVDMTPEMLAKARGVAQKDGVTNVTFRLGEIEHLPVGDESADCVISNCVINLSPEKPQVYREMNRVLRPGGRVSISDVMRMKELPQSLKSATSYAC